MFFSFFFLSHVLFVLPQPFVESVDESLDLHDFLSLCLVSVTNLLQLSHLLVVDSLLIAITW